MPSGSKLLTFCIVTKMSTGRASNFSFFERVNSSCDGFTGNKCFLIDFLSKIPLLGILQHVSKPMKTRRAEKTGHVISGDGMGTV